MSVLSRKLKRHRLEHLNETLNEVWKYTDQQRSAIFKHIKCFSCISLSVSYALSLNRHWSIVWSMTVCWMLDQPVIQTSLQLINISHRILIDPLLYHCRDSVIYALKSGMFGRRYDNWTLKSGISQQSCSMVVRARCADLLYFLNLSWFPVSDYIKNIGYTGDRKFTS